MNGCAPPLPKTISATAAATWPTTKFSSATAAKCDTGNILDIFGHKNKIAVSDPVYPVYVDTNVMAGHTGEANDAGTYAKLVYLPCKPSNGFIPEPPKRHVDVVYLCSPNNPTGAAANRPQLEAWVKYALEHKAVILFDAAYEAYITDANLPHSIYEIPGARECAIEFRSCSKNGGFTGVRCAFTVVPKSLNAQTKDGEFQPLHPLWLRRMTTKFNGVSYIVAARRGGALLAGRQGAGAGAHRALSRQRESVARRREEGRTEGFRRRERALHLGESAERRHELAGVRQNSWAKPMWSSRPAAVLARKARAISASAPSTAAPTRRKSRAGCRN